MNEDGFLEVLNAYASQRREAQSIDNAMSVCISIEEKTNLTLFNGDYLTARGEEQLGEDFGSMTLAETMSTLTDLLVEPKTASLRPELQVEYEFLGDGSTYRFVVKSKM